MELVIFSFKIRKLTSTNYLSMQHIHLKILRNQVY